MLFHFTRATLITKAIMSSRRPPREKYPYRPVPSYLTALRGTSWKHTPTPWNWPSLWACLLGAAIQIAAGLVPTSISFFLLIAADADRCPVAVGGARIRPFLAWVLGVIIGIYVCEVMTGEVRNPNFNWVMWGSFAEVWHWLTKKALKNGYMGI